MREILGMTLANLEFKSGVSRGHLSQIENGNTEVSLNKAISIAKSLNCSLSALVDEYPSERDYLKADESVLLEMYRQKSYPNMLLFLAKSMEESSK